MRKSNGNSGLGVCRYRYHIGGWCFAAGGMQVCCPGLDVDVLTQHLRPCGLKGLLARMPAVSLRGMRYVNCLQLIWDSPVNAVEPLWTYNIIEAVTFGGGTTCFFIGAILFLARQVTLSFCMHGSAVPPPHRSLAAAGHAVHCRTARLACQQCSNELGHLRH